MAEQEPDAEWGPGDPAKLDAVRRGLFDLSAGDDVGRLEEAVAAALRDTAGVRFDEDRLWERLERSLDGTGLDDFGQDGEDSTPGK